MIPTYLIPLADHLWQSTLFAAAVAILCFLLRCQRAAARYSLWLAASLKFLIPLALLIHFAALLQPTPPAVAVSPAASLARQITQPFALPVPTPLLAAVPDAPSPVPAILFTLWLAGFIAASSTWLRAWLRMRAALRSASAIAGPASIQTWQTGQLVEPCVFGIFRPVLLLPQGIAAHLTSDQLQAVFLHELSHVRRRDNLTAAFHMLVETIFWFCPPVYWIGRRLLREREAACDEEVLRTFPEPETYARGILAVCRFGMQRAPVCAAGVTGPDLIRRIEAIMAASPLRPMGLARGLLLAAALGAALAGPFWTGLLFVRAACAQTPTPSAPVSPFAVATIKPNRTGERNSGFRRFTGGMLDARNITVGMLLSFAYDIPSGRILQAPAWLDSEHFDILAKPDESGGRIDTSMAAIRTRTQALLADRFSLALHKDTRQLPIFRLLVDKDGTRNLHPPQGTASDLFTNGHHVTCQAVTMQFFARNFLTGELGAPVVDQTGMDGKFDFSMDWAPDERSPRRPDAADSSAPSDPAGPTLFTALREQLGLRLESGKGPVEVLIVDRVAKPSEN